MWHIPILCVSLCISGISLHCLCVYMRCISLYYVCVCMWHIPVLCVCICGIYSYTVCVYGWPVFLYRVCTCGIYSHTSYMCACVSVCDRSICVVVLRCVLEVSFLSVSGCLSCHRGNEQGDISNNSVRLHTHVLRHGCGFSLSEVILQVLLHFAERGLEGLPVSAPSCSLSPCF